MNVFNKLVLKKREKMLALALFLTIAILLHQANGINLTYIVKKEGQNLQPSCIAEENERYAGIGWIYPLPKDENQEPNITTKFEPDLQNEFNCKFEKNDKCNRIWALKNWERDENSTRTLDLIFDERWEDLPTTYTGKNSKQFKDRFEIPNIFKIGISLRAEDSVELLICDGWNPHTYPCYHLNISKTEIFLRKYMTLPENVSTSDRFLDSYQAFANILSGAEWRNFIIDLDKDGTFSLRDVSVNRIVIQYEDKEPLKPMYLLVRSIQPALWKIHQNHFIYTKTAQISRLGPILNLPSKDLCVALYVSTCEQCVMSFIIMKGHERKVLMDVTSKNFEWRLIKIKDNQILVDKLNVFVETKFANGSKTGEGFWALDDVRVCHENEVKVTFLKLKEEVKEDDDISCQVIQNPKWRPKKLIYDKIRDTPMIDKSSNSTSISLNWTQEDPNNQINYFITYQANDLCDNDLSSNLMRIKSNGFVMTKHNEVLLENLVAFTKYNITFSSMLHEKEERFYITTQELAQPTSEELPNRLQIQVQDTYAYASWDKIKCNSIYGPILYFINVTNLSTNTSKKPIIQTDNAVKIDDLEPFTTYNLEITTSRSLKNVETNTNIVKLSTNFRTPAGIAPPIENLEIYSVDKNSVSLRYNLPKNSRGHPKLIQVMRCSAISFAKCKSALLAITPCKLWLGKYCVDITNLIPNQKYTFKVSIRNDKTHVFGEETKVVALLEDKVPGSPTNISYQIVDCQHTVEYCHLNISWLHPYYQNSTITAFHIVLNASDTINNKNIQEVLKITNSSYLPKYEHQIKYIPYSTHYELYVQSANTEYKSEFVQTHVKTADIGDHIDQNPTMLSNTPKSVTFKLPALDHRLKSYALTTIVQDFNRKQAVPKDILNDRKVRDHLCHNFGKSWILPKMKITDNNTNILKIGEGDNINKYLEPETQYCFTFIVTNVYKDTEHDVVYYKKLKTLKDSSPDTKDTKTSGSSKSNHLYILLLLLLLVPAGFLVYRYIKKRRPRPKQQETRENVYESLPFEECEENCVSNETYDKLLHK